MKDMRRATWLLGLAIGAGAAACNDVGDLCLQTGCEAGLAVAVVDDAGAGGALREGSYRFTLKTDAAEESWTCAVPAEPCEHDFFVELEGGDAQGTLQLHAEAGERGLEMELVEIRGKVWSGPETLTVTVERDEVVVVEETLSPTYRDPLVPDACALCRTYEGEPLVVHVPK